MVTTQLSGQIATALELERQATMAAMETPEASERVSRSRPVGGFDAPA
jgi:hypothetical protein